MLPSWPQSTNFRVLTTQTLLLFHGFLLITVSNHLKDHILTLACSWSLFLNINDLCEQHRSSNSKWRQSKKAVVFIQQNPVPLLPFSQDYHTAFYFTKLLCSHVTKYCFCPKTGCKHLLFCCASYLAISTRHSLLCSEAALCSTYTAVLKEKLGDCWWNSTSMKLMTPTGYPQLGFSGHRTLHFKGVRIYSILARWLRVGQQQSEIRKKK